MSRITRPANGSNFIITNKGFVDGVFLMDGQRRFRSLGKLERLEKTPAGRRRTPRQLATQIQNLWDEKRAALEQELGRAHGAEEPISEVLQRWMDVSRGIRAPTTLKLYLATANQYLSAVGDHPIGGTSLEHVDRFIQALSEKAISPASININLRTLKTFFNWAAERDLLARVPKIKRYRCHERVHACCPKRMWTGSLLAFANCVFGKDSIAGNGGPICCTSGS